MSRNPLSHVVVIASVLAVALLAVSPQASSQATAPRSGVYLEQPDAEPVLIPSSTSQDVETKGVMKAALTQGFARPKFVVRHAGPSAEVQVTTPQPSFVFRFPAQSRGRQASMDMAAMMELMEGLPPNSTHPKEFSLVTMTVEGDARTLDTGALENVKLKIESLGERAFRVRPETPLAAGEYAFFLSDKNKGGGVPSQIWAFSRR
jgi:hypothetical protein